VAEKYGLYKYIRFNSEVKQARWDDEKMKWKIDVEVSGDKDSQFASSYVLNSDFLASAVGQLNVPREPEIPGLKDFQGRMMHSARWDWTYNFENKRIAIIGNGLLSPERDNWISC
jgi:cation diffusion facilitator CzcD-associated flavoprotein CzcO